MKYRLRKLEAKDAPFMLEWMHDNDVTQNLGTDFSSKTIEDAEAFIESANDSETGNLHRACVDENDMYLGTVSLKAINRENNNAEYAICFRSCAHGSGASRAATEEILRIGFEELKLEKIYLYLYGSNERANRFYQKAGFVFEGRLRKHTMHKGVLEDVLWYGILREEWSRLETAE